MAVGTLITEEDWAGRPATKGDLMMVQTHLEGMIKDVRVEVAHLRVSMAWMTVGVATVLGGLVTLFEFLS